MKYKHALFLNPYIENTATSIMGLFPPTGLEYVATSAKDLTDKLTLLDLRYEDDLQHAPELLDFIKDNKVDIICVAVGWDRQYKEICELLNKMPKNIPLIVGGYKATEEAAELFNICPTITAIVRGEGEDTIQEIFTGVPFEDILGLSYRDNETVVHNANRPLSDVNKIAAPDRSLRKNDYRLKLNGVGVKKMTFDTVLSARGCPFNCKFCTFSLNPLGQKRTYAARTVASVMSEIDKIDANTILFSDDNFFTIPKRAEEICDAIIAKKIKKRFITQARIDISKHPRLLAKMNQAGFKLLLLGIESGHDRILTQLDKGFDSKTIREAFSVLRKYPIYCHGYFIYGNIGETEEEMLYISQFAKEIKLDSITFQKLRIEKFSPLREIAENTPGYHVTDRGELYSDAYSHATLKKIGRKIKFSFYTPMRLIKIVIKVVKARLFTLSEVISLLNATPRILYRVLEREMQKKRLGNSIKRIFMKNS